MCGIAGYFGPETIPEERLRACLALMRRRGPDHAAWRAFETPGGKHAYLLHSRLSIIDLDPRANQPLSEGPLTIALNGEVYDYRELRARLEREGERFVTTSDTEVLLRALARRGLAALEEAEGMWAFALYDERRAELTLARDRFGEKPLYLLRDAGGVYFGSEPKFLAVLRGKPLAPDREQVVRFLVNGYRALGIKRRTFLEGVTELPRASWLTLGDSGESSGVSWRPRLGPEDGMSFDEAVTGTRERLIRAVELRLRADVPLAFCMSGGIDSNGIIAIAKRVLGHDVHGFTIANTDARYEEQALVEHAVSELSLRHTALSLRRGGFLEGMRALVRHRDAPVLTISYYVHALLMEAIARAGYRISLSGTAADELFSGYFDHHLLYLASVRGDEALHREALEAWCEKVRPFVRNPFLQDPDRFVREPTFRGHLTLESERFSGFLVRPFREAFEEERFGVDLLRDRMLDELFFESVPVILHEDDANAMFHSVENRSPYLDRELFEWSARIPTRHLVRRGLAKAVLREALRGIVPDRVLDNPRKVGFNAPVLDLVDPRDPAFRESVLRDGPIFELVRRDAIAELLERGGFSDSENKLVFSFLSAKLFLEEIG